ncbi:hypothetical protein ONK29_27460, partial [Salmonella enterica subsp. enterica serovar Anatum]|nr:hypothetical protein [Salmonella enterica subsp. enterica serovar Anatum]
KDQAAAQESANLSSKAVDLNGVKLLVSELAGIEPKMLRTMVEPIRPPEAACRKVFLNERWLELNIGSITPTFLQEIFINYNQY